MFKKRIYAKWVLSGEHSVLRSQPAIVYPLSHYYIDFSYKNTEDSFRVDHSGQDTAGLDLSFIPLFEEALKLVNKKRKDLRGILNINSQIPFGAGLGASAILSVACALFFEYQSWISKKELAEFAKKLEDLFHDKSSGLDIAGVLEGRALLFKQGQIIKHLEPSKHKPFLYLSYSGRRSSTLLSISSVKKFFKNKSADLAAIDQIMTRSVESCLLALDSENQEDMIKNLKEGLLLGESCFEKMGLLSYDLKAHSQALKKQGALATKPTGSGLGGYVISLWDKEAPQDLGIDFKTLSI